MALSTARIHKARGRPPLLAAGISSLIRSHSSSVRSLGYVFSFIVPFYTTHEDFSDRLSGHFANDLRDAQLSARTHRLQVNIGIVALQQPERHVACFTGDTLERFPTFELARHHFANPVPTQESFLQNAMVLQTA